MQTATKISLISLFLLIILLVLTFGCSTKILSQEIAAPISKNISVVVSDIDGTLTPNVPMYFMVRENAATALQKFANKGYTIIYVTTRVPMFQSNLKNWLDENRFPKGNLHVAQTSEERDNPAKFKAQILNQYSQLGWKIKYAYGDSSTDFIAYNKAGIPKTNIFGLKRKGRSNCMEGEFNTCLNDWTEHLEYIEKNIPNVP